MELWDQNVAPYGEELEALDNSTRADLVLDVVASTMPLFEPPFDDFVGGRGRVQVCGQLSPG